MRISNNLGMWGIRYLQNLQNQQSTLTRQVSQATIPLNVDVASNVIAERIISQVRGFQRAMKDTFNTIGMLNTAEGGLENISNSLQRMRELAVQASNGTLTQSDRDALQKEYEDLAKGINRTVQQTTYNNIRVLGGDVNNLNVQTGPNSGQNATISIQRVDLQGLAQMDSQNVSLADTNLNSVQNAQNALKVLDRAIENVSSVRGNVGATTNRLVSAVRNMSDTMINLTSSVSTLTDADMARSVMELTRNRLLQQATSGVMSQSNTNGLRVLSLLL